jgi:hypothetical protein
MPDQSLPTVAPITQAQTAAPDISSILAGISPSPQQQNVPMTQVGHDAPNVNLRAPHMQAPTAMETPNNNTSQERNRVQQKNTLSSISNTISGFTNARKAEKFENLKTEISTVMKAQQQVDNANVILQNPNASEQDKKMAQMVLDSNKKVIQSKLDPGVNKKTAKDIQKAFDVSFTDPEKNNTDEVKAMQAAHKETQRATGAGTVPNTPEEKKIAELAANGGKPPVQQQAQANSQAGNKPQQSSTPYADKFLSSQPLSISENPQYAAQLKQEEKQRELQMQYAVPRIIDAYAKQEMETLRQQGLNNRMEYAGTMKYREESNKLVNQANIANAHNKTELEKQRMANAGAMARTELRVNAAMGAANAKGIKGTALEAKMHEQAIAAWTTQIDAVTKANTELANQQVQNRSKSGEVIDKNKEDLIRNTMDQNSLFISQATDNRQKTMTKIYGKPVTGAATDNTKGYVNGGASTTGTSAVTSGPGGNTFQSVGGDESDSDEADTASDAAENAAIDKFLVDQ